MSREGLTISFAVEMEDVDSWGGLRAYSKQNV